MNMNMIILVTFVHNKKYYSRCYCNRCYLCHHHCCINIKINISWKIAQLLPLFLLLLFLLLLSPFLKKTNISMSISHMVSSSSTIYLLVCCCYCFHHPYCHPYPHCCCPFSDLLGRVIFPNLCDSDDVTIWRHW